MAAGNSRLGVVAALTDIVLAVVLAAFLLTGTEWDAEAVPRAIVLGALYSTPGVIGLVGIWLRRPWLLIAAALPLVPGAFLSFGGATLIFLVPAVLLVIAAQRVPRSPAPPSAAVQVAQFTLVPALLLGAAIAVLFVYTESGCRPIPGGETCGSTFITVPGVLVAAVLSGAAILLSLWPRAASERRATTGSPR